MNLLVLVFFLSVCSIIGHCCHIIVFFTGDLLCYVQFNTSFDWQVIIVYLVNVKNMGCGL